MERGAPFAVRRVIQQQRFALPDYPTTTIGSFPQTAAIRAARAAYKQGALSTSSPSSSCAATAWAISACMAAS